MAEKTDVPLIVEQTKELIDTGSGSELLEKGTWSQRNGDFTA